MMGKHSVRQEIIANVLADEAFVRQISLPLSTRAVAEIESSTKSEMEKLKQEKTTTHREGREIVVSRWSLLEDRYAQGISRQAIEDRIAQTGEGTNSRSVRFHLAAMKAEEELRRRKSDGRSLEEAQQLLASDLRFVFDYLGGLSGVSIPSLRQTIVKLARLRARMFDRTGSDRDYLNAAAPVLLKRVQLDSPVEHERRNAKEVLNSFVSQQKSLFGRTVCSISDVEKVCGYFEECRRRNRPARVHIPSCPSRRPLRLTYSAPEERGSNSRRSNRPVEMGGFVRVLS